MLPLTDFGADPETQVIRVGLNADLSGPFASLVSEIVAAQEVYWEVFNENGGYKGWTVEPCGYATDVGIQNYQTLAAETDDGVLMITENSNRARRSIGRFDIAALSQPGRTDRRSTRRLTQIGTVEEVGRLGSFPVRGTTMITHQRYA